MRVALDTSTVYALFKNEPFVATRLRFAEAIFLPLPVIGEILFAAKKSAQCAANLKRVRELRHVSVALIPTEETASFYSDIRLDLEKKGRPIPVNDLWIAALCREHSVPLATRDKHFDYIEGLQILRW